jgi:hypothetical protein
MLASAASPKFLNDDPLQVEVDTQDASGLKPAELKLFTDLAYNFIKGSEEISDVRAENVNTVDEVPDSSWFTNRAGARPLTAREVATGPDTDDGPAAGTWTVTSSKSDGVTPGFTVSDGIGQRWFLKFDARGYRGMTTGTDVAVSKLMWALGYHVPENHIAYVRPEQFVVGDAATFTSVGGTRRRMRQADVDALLAKIDREPDGSYRVVASKALPGRPVGRIRFFGTRPDDPNDLVPHEHRRELRGYRVFAAWLNHWDAKALNSLDTLVNVDGRSVVRHHLIDFGSALGSAGLEAGEYWEGEEYIIEPRKTLRQALTFGFSIPRWRTERFYENSAIGRFPENNTAFEPDLWRPRVPNRAFLHARDDDKFWAARKVAAMSTNLIRAALRRGQFGDAEAEEFLVRALVERRIAIARAYLPRVNPISDPVLSAGTLTFVNAAVDMDVAVAPAGYRAVWSKFDNATGANERIGESASQTTSMTAPEGIPQSEGAYIKIELSAVGAVQASWEQPVHAYFRLRDGQWKLVGFERLPER